MKVFVTGANGFLGSVVVRMLLDRGHAVVAAVRRLPEGQESPSLSYWVGDLRAPSGLASALSGVDCVVHAAAAKAGDVHDQLASTVVATEKLLGAMAEAGVQDLVLISSFAIYDFEHMPARSTVTEASAVLDEVQGRDAYATTKALQERLVAQSAVPRVTMLRPGVVIGPANYWNGRLGVQLGRLWLVPGGRAEVPIVTVEDCALAVALACERQTSEASSRIVVNLAAEAPPTQLGYVRWLKREQSPKARIVVVPLLLWRALVAVLAAWGRRQPDGLKMPSYLTEGAFHARFKPLRYDVSAASRLLGWRPSPHPSRRSTG